MTKQWRLLLAYEGTGYCGWQDNRQEPSVEAVLRPILCQVLGSIHKLQAASRTDTGVHALGQVVTFLTEKPLSPKRLFASLNSLLPSDIRVRHIDEVPLSFHPTLSSSSKEYHYRLCTAQVLLPMERRYVWHYPYPLNVPTMRQAANLFLGSHDFRAFCNANPPAVYTDSQRRIDRLDIIEVTQGELRIEVEGNHFLYKMVRNLVGTLAQIGRGVLTTDSISLALKSGQRCHAGMTAAAHGLTLVRIHYPKEEGDPADIESTKPPAARA